MDTIPYEIARKIAENCVVSSLIQLRQVSRKWFYIGSAVLQKIETLDLDNDIGPLLSSEKVKTPNVEWERTDALRTFLENRMRNIKTLKINSSKVKIQQSNFILFGNGLQLINSLEIRQDPEVLQLSNDIFYGLHAFPNLKRLSLIKWMPDHISGRGGVHRTTLPVEKLMNIQHLHISGNSLIIHVLNVLHQHEQGRLQRLSLTFTEHSTQRRCVMALLMLSEKYPELQLGPLENHAGLRPVQLFQE